MTPVHGASAAGCDPFPEPGFEDPSSRAFWGDYANPNYPYAVTIPPGLVGFDGPAPAPHHGFGIVLATAPRAYLSVDGSYNALGWESSREAAVTQLGWSLRNVDRPLDLVVEVTCLGPLEAMRFDLDYRCDGGDGATTRRRERRVVASDGEVVYTIALDADARRLAADGVVFDAIVASFRLTRPAAVAHQPPSPRCPPQNASGSSPPQ